jgi:hypothetical protein
MCLKTLASLIVNLLNSELGLSYVQRREDGSTNFTRGWNKYVGGFGHVNREYWLGNEVIHQLTYETNY